MLLFRLSFFFFGYRNKTQFNNQKSKFGFSNSESNFEIFGSRYFELHHYAGMGIRESREIQIKIS